MSGCGVVSRQKKWRRPATVLIMLHRCRMVQPSRLAAKSFAPPKARRLLRLAPQPTQPIRQRAMSLNRPNRRYSGRPYTYFIQKGKFVKANTRKKEGFALKKAKIAPAIALPVCPPSMTKTREYRRDVRYWCIRTRTYNCRHLSGRPTRVLLSARRRVRSEDRLREAPALSCERL